MTSVILEWDPGRVFSAQSYPAVVAEVEHFGEYLARWPIDPATTIPARTEVWLLVQGGRPNQRGLIGHGVTVGEPFTAEQVDPSADGPPLFVMVQFDLLLSEGDQLRTDELTVHVPDVDWKAGYRSGSLLPPHAESAVRSRWAEHVLNRASPYADSLDPIPGAYPEFALTQTAANRYERSPEARAVAIAHHGSSCHACGFDFEATYGPVGAGLIHMHHTVPGSRLVPGYELDPISDLVPLCPNCHHMAHRGHLNPYTVAELRAMIAASGHLPGEIVSPERQQAQDAARRITQAGFVRES